jgi:lipopolysaccharide transport system ATP-binding protein
MYLRLAFAVAAHLEPEVLLVDEVLAVGDAEFQKKCLGRMSEVGQSGRTVVFVSHSMPAMLRLCPRLLLLNNGTVVADGPAAEVVRTYMESGLGSSAQREWSDGSRRPGDDVAVLRSVRVVRSDSGEAVDEVDVREAVRIEVSYEQVEGLRDVRPAVFVTVRNDDGVVLFHSQDFVNHRWRDTRRRAGGVIAACLIPPNFLAEGRHYVDVGASSHGPHVEHFYERDVVSFQVVDRSTGEGVRGDWAGEWPGVIRPMLEWQIECGA